MKIRIYSLLMVLAILMPAATLRAEEVTGVSDPFVFGSPVSTPLASLSLLVVFFLIAAFVFRHYYKTKKQAV